MGCLVLPATQHGLSVQGAVCAATCCVGPGRHTSRRHVFTGQAAPGLWLEILKHIALSCKLAGGPWDSNVGVWRAQIEEATGRDSCVDGCALTLGAVNPFLAIPRVDYCSAFTRMRSPCLQLLWQLQGQDVPPSTPLLFSSCRPSMAVMKACLPRSLSTAMEAI